MIGQIQSSKSEKIFNSIESLLGPLYKPVEFIVGCEDGDNKFDIVGLFEGYNDCVGSIDS